MNAKPLLIETIRIQNGRVRNIKYHNQRCNASRKALFGTNIKIDLRKHIDTSKALSAEIKCRITYDDQVKKVEYQPYSIRPIHSLAMIEIGDFDYSHKYADRKKLKEFFDQRGKKDDILMIKNGWLTDTYYANVAFLKQGKWYTPKSPLLHGTSRARLIQKGEIIPADIHINQIKEYSHISIFNAMIPFKNIMLSTQVLLG